MARRRRRFVPPKEDPPLGLDWVAYEYVRRGRRDYAKIKGKFTKVRGDFLATIADSEAPKLAALGITAEERQGMREGIVPEGFAVHHIWPLDSRGGTNEFDNLVLLPQTPYHDAIHRYLAPQLGSLKVSRARTVKLPVVEGPVFVPPSQALTAFASARQDAWKARRAMLDMPSDQAVQAVTGSSPPMGTAP
ncbi:MAG: hypothetical protein AAF556_04370 [Pseudomonadota bacterium]